MGLIEEISDYLWERGLTPDKEWGEAIGIVIVSVFSHRTSISSKLGGLKPNLWYLYIGASGIAHKTVPIKYFLNPLLYLYKDETGEDLLLPQSFSMEGMV